MRLVAILAALVLVPACMQTTRPTLEQQGQTGSDLGTQGGSVQQPGIGQQQGSEQPQGSMDPGTAVQKMEAKVVTIDRGAGTMTVSSNGTNYSFRATPTQLQGYRENQDVSLQYQAFNRIAWLVFEGTGTGVGGTGSADEGQKFSGSVSQITPSRGTVVIGNRTFNAHPTQLQRLSEGQQVSVSFQSVDGNVWLQDVQGTGGSGQTGAQGSYSGTQQGGTGGSGQAGTQGDCNGTQQGGTGGSGQMGTQQQGTMQGGMQPGMAQDQKLEGQVVSINPNVGEMTVTASGKTIALRGTPTQLQRYTKGQRVSLQYRTFGKSSWLVGEGIGGSGTEAGSAQRFTGTVAKIDQAQGTLIIGDRTFFAHPTQLQQINQGQQITVTYVAHGNAWWLQNVQTGSGTGGTGQEGTQQQDQGTY